jgi:hypothetical protein
VQALPASGPALNLGINASSIPELNGTAIGTVVRSSSDTSQPLTVLLSSSDTASATVPASVVIPANQSQATFTIAAVHDTTRGTRSVTITATAAGSSADTASLLITDSDRIWHNAARPTDVDNDGFVSPIDAVLIINFLNAGGGGPVPSGSPPPFYDVDADNSISPTDAVLVINQLNAASSAPALAAAAEGESASAEVAGDVFPPSANSLEGLISLLALDAAEHSPPRRPRAR